MNKDEKELIEKINKQLTALNGEFKEFDELIDDAKKELEHE